jgi:metallo-beta-lactamase family protein
MSFDSENPWLPDDAGETFDPQSHFDATTDEETPMVVTPRGGGRQVGRSCYQVDTEHSTFLIDCGLSQSDGGQFPDFRGLEIDQIDAVLLTHAHIDHCGGLPVLENRGFLEDDAPIIATPPTTQIAQTLLDDALKIHKHETRNSAKQQRFTETDVEAVYDRFQPVSYGEYLIQELTEEANDDPLSVQLGNAGHLLGSAWISLQTGGHTTVFSGDLGGRAAHLPDIDTPPQGDQLFIESTYGGTHTHQSITDAEGDLWNHVRNALEQSRPILIPTFAVGRAQLILRLLRNRIPTLPKHLRREATVVVDGMAQEACQGYRTHLDEREYFDESIVNEYFDTSNGGEKNVLLPENVTFPSSDEERQRILEQFSPESGSNIPIIVSPSGMLTGGHSPRYLSEIVSRFNDASILLTGYQANGTGGDRLVTGINAGESEVGMEFDTDPFDTDWVASDRVVWTNDDDGNRVTRTKVPLDWVNIIGGLSAHGAQQTLLHFARNVDPEIITLIHGPAYAQEALGEHFINNVESAKQVARARLLTPIEVTAAPDLNTAALRNEMVDSPGHQDFEDRLDDLTESLGITNRMLAETKEEALTDTDQLRAIVREELAKAGIEVEDTE